MKISILILGITLVLSYQTKGQENKESYSNLVSSIDAIVHKHEFNGVILVATDTTTIYSNVVGFSDLDPKTRIKFSDQFVIGSISKQITAVLILREFEKGNLRLEDTIHNYLEKIKQPWSKKITIHHLLTHTHGISDIEKPLEFTEGTQFKYSQLGYELLAQILEKITGKSFEISATELFEEHKLKNTFHPQHKKYHNLVKGYVENEQGILIFAPNSLDNYVPAGGFISNATDLKKWNQKLYSGQLVTKESLKLMTTKYATRIHPIFETVEYGYGLLFKEGEENIQIGALGYSPGFVSACYYYPQDKTQVIVLENNARDLGNFKNTFRVHTAVMDVVKKQSLRVAN
ncbi:beta-lactamase family protein [Cellulophaga sp. E16_2]|uniref:serine hydrolase domain-containing protein n=1 Tax=Cellulophaga sp. E16_2 TaxID=2789297 RepID=UPI001A9203EC|nr:serine hydrolase domain-containing protein [Cellulophaga sp. E16_2]MBO0593231.1 beta-lactamase family protein [Cellulophaga sp. E16_2]